MTDPQVTDPYAPVMRVLRSLPRAILLGTAASAIGMTALRWIGLLIPPLSPPPVSVWVEYVALRAVIGACVGAGLYAAARLPHGWLRTCLFWILIFLIIEGDMPDFASRPLDRYLTVWAGSSLLSGAFIGTLFYVWERRSRPRQAP